MSLRRRFAYIPGQHRARPLRNGLILLGLSAILIYCGYTRDIPFVGGGGTEVRAHFAEAANMRKGTPVRVRGVNVGRVERVERNRDGRGVIATLRIDDGKGVELRRDASASVYWRTLLGFSMYVELSPGSPSAPGLDGATIARTQTQVEFDQLLGGIGTSGLKGMQTTIGALREGFADGDATRAALDRLAPAMGPLGKALPALRGAEPGRDLPRLVGAADRALDALGRDEAALAGLIDDGRIALGVTAARSADLGATLDRAPAALGRTQATMARLRTTLDKLDPVAERLRPGARRLPSALAAARPLVDGLRRTLPLAEPVLDDASPTLVSLRGLARSGVPLIADATPTLDRANERIIPFLEQRDGDTKLRNYESLGPFFAAASSGASSFDGGGHYLNFQAGPGEKSLGASPCQPSLIDQPPRATKVDCSALVDGLSALIHGTGRRR